MLRKYTFGLVKDIRFGLNSAELLPDVVGKLVGTEKEVLIITDSGIKKASILDKVTALLEEDDYEVRSWDRVKPEPTLDVYEEAKDYVRQIEPSIIIGLGGGSPMDVASTTAALAKNMGDVEEYIGPPFHKFKKGRLPLITVPTTAGTGAEVTPFDVVIDKEGRKRDIIDDKSYADAAIVDPMLTLDLPKDVTLRSGMDALAHAVEGMLSTVSNPITEALASDVMSRIMNNLPRAYSDGQDLKARYNMSWAALEAGIVISQTGTPLGHAFAYTFAGQHDIPHGESCGFCIPYSILYSIPAALDKIMSIAKPMEVPIDGLNKREVAFKTVETTKKMAEDFGFPVSLEDMGIQKDEIPDMIKRLQSVYSYVTENSPQIIEEEAVRELFEMMWEGTSKW